MIVSLDEPPITMSVGASYAYELLTAVTGIAVYGPIRVSFDIEAYIYAVRLGDKIDNHLPQLAYYFADDAVYVQQIGNEFTMVFFYVGNDTLHMMVTPNPTPEVGRCIIILEKRGL